MLVMGDEELDTEIQHKGIAMSGLFGGLFLVFVFSWWGEGVEGFLFDCFNVCQSSMFSKTKYISTTELLKQFEG